MAEQKVLYEGLLSKWKSPFCFELAGQTFHLVMDDGHEYLLNFVSGEIVMWSERGEPARWEHYECLKGDETTYFINAEMHGFKYRTGATLVLDTEQRLVTMLIATHGENPKHPFMVTQRFIFGAIKMDGEELPRKRHGYTMDMAGTRITWAYDERFVVTHVYYHPNYYRMGPMAASRQLTPEQIAAREKNPTDEPSTYIKIKENLYLFSFNEKTHFLREGGNGNDMTLLIDTARMHDVGRSFGLDGRTRIPENYMFSAIGTWAESDGEIENKPSAYRV